MGQQEIYQLLKKSKEPLSVEEIEKKLNNSNYKSVSRACKQMYKHNEIKRIITKKPKKGKNECIRMVSESKYYLSEKDKK